MSLSIRFIRIELSGTAVIYTLMFHYVNHSLCHTLYPGLLSCRPHHPVFVPMDCYCLDKSSLRILLRSSYI
jgi:hypothetical protein